MSKSTSAETVQSTPDEVDKNYKQLAESVVPTVESVNAYLAQLGLTPDDIIFKGDEYPLADKSSLVDVALFVVDWKFGLSKNFAAEYVQMRYLRLDNGDKGTIFDSGTGIYAQMNDITNDRIDNGKPPYNALSLPNGLRSSSYAADPETGRPAGTTYYIA